MTAVDFYYDFRSPYAYLASRRLDVLTSKGAEIRWKPVSIDVLLNLQAGREPWADYQDPLPPPKRAHLLADVPRMAKFWNIELKRPNPPRPRSTDAMSIAAALESRGVDHDTYRREAFAALWLNQSDLGELTVIKACLARGGLDPAISDQPLDAWRHLLAETTRHAYKAGVFGVPTFVCDSEIYFGADRMDVLAGQL